MLLLHTKNNTFFFAHFPYKLDVYKSIQSRWVLIKQGCFLDKITGGIICYKVLQAFKCRERITPDKQIANSGQKKRDFDPVLMDKKTFDLRRLNVQNELKAQKENC